MSSWLPGTLQFALYNGLDNDPILASIDDMVGAGLVNSLARPDDTTGTSIFAGDLDGKWQEILIEAVPGLRRMAALAASTKHLRRLTNYGRRRARRNIEPSVHRIAKPRSFRQPSTQRRRGARQR